MSQEDVSLLRQQLVQLEARGGKESRISLWSLGHKGSKAFHKVLKGSKGF